MDKLKLSSLTGWLEPSVKTKTKQSLYYYHLANYIYLILLLQANKARF